MRKVPHQVIDLFLLLCKFVWKVFLKNIAVVRATLSVRLRMFCYEETIWVLFYRSRPSCKGLLIPSTVITTLSKQEKVGDSIMLRLSLL